jgi:hypothetical protein
MAQWCPPISRYAGLRKAKYELKLHRILPRPCFRGDRAMSKLPIQELDGLIAIPVPQVRPASLRNSKIKAAIPNIPGAGP